MSHKARAKTAHTGHVSETHKAVCVSDAVLLGLLSNLSCGFQEWFTGEHDLLPSLDEPPLPNNPLLVDQKECPLGDSELDKRGIAGQPGILLSHLQVWKVAEQWIGQLERFCERFLRERMTGADTENLDIQFLEFRVIGLPGR